MGSFLTRHVTFLAVLAALGAATMAGLLFAFSNFVMRALTQLPPAYGMEAMQRVNVEIVNPVFLVVFMGTPIVYGLVTLAALQPELRDARMTLLLAAACYLIGVLGVTMLVNIPLNNGLGTLGPADAAQAWPTYVATWTWWNHVRTVFAFGAVLATIMALSGHTASQAR